MKFAPLVLLSLALAASPDDRTITFTGEVSEGQTIRKSIGQDLDFVLEPSVGETTGWTLEVLPSGKNSDSACGEFLAVATPPFHFENARYLDTEYGITAQEAVHNSPREFSFVLNCADFETERKRVELVIYSSSASKQEIDDAQAKLGTSPSGRGKLWIEDSRITPSHKTGTAEDLGAIHWIKFKVEIRFPAAPIHEQKPTR